MPTRRKFTPKRAKRPSQKPDFADSYHEFSGTSIHENSPVTIELDNEPTPVYAHSCIDLQVIGIIRDDKLMGDLEAKLREGDKVLFILMGGWTEVWEGLVGKNRRVYSMRQVVWHQKDMINKLKQLGYVEPIRLVDDSVVSTTKQSSTTNKPSGSTNLYNDLPTDELELRKMLETSSDKGDKRRIRAQLRKVNPNWSKQ